MTATISKSFELQDFYEVSDEAVFDARVLAVAAKLMPASDVSLLPPGQRTESGRRSSRRVHEAVNVDQRGSDGDDFSGFVAKADIRAADGRELTVIDSWYGGNETGIPRPNCSWSAEFDDGSVAEDFWENHWRPAFDGFDFVEKASTYLDEHPDIPRRTIRIQQLGLLHAWHSQRLGEQVLLEKFSTSRHELVRTPGKYESDEMFEPGKVYIKPLKNSFGIVRDHLAETCLAAFMVKGRETLGYAGRYTVPDTTYVQWANGSLEAYSHPISAENGPVALTSAELDDN